MVLLTRFLDLRYSFAASSFLYSAPSKDNQHLDNVEHEPLLCPIGFFTKHQPPVSCESVNHGWIMPFYNHCSDIVACTQTSRECDDTCAVKRINVLGPSDDINMNNKRKLSLLQNMLPRHAHDFSYSLPATE